MANLGPRYQNQTYSNLLQVEGGLTSELKPIQDGDGNSSAISISLTAVSVSGLSVDVTNNLAGGNAGAIPWQSDVSKTSFVPAGAAGTVLASTGGGAPAWVNTIQYALNSNYSNNIANGSAGQLLYQNDVNDTSFVTNGTSGQVLTSNGSSAPSWSNYAPNAYLANAASNIAGGTSGELLYQSNVGTTSKVATGTVGQVLKSNGTAAPGWGTLTASDVGAVALNGTTAMTGSLQMGYHTITQVAAPTSGYDAANKAYVDSIATGLQVKTACRVATTTNISLSGAATIDGVVVSTSDRVLVKNQTTSADNGIYIANTSGTWTRATDADTWSELVGAAVFITAGSTQASTTWVSNITAGGTLGTTSITFVQFGASQTYTAGTGLSLVGSTFSLATPVSVANGGSGAATLTGILKGNGSSAFSAATGSDVVTLIGSNAVANATTASSCTGNAATATALQNIRTINAIAFDGTANITIQANTPYALTFNDSGVGDSGVGGGFAWNGNADKIISYNTLGAAAYNGANASGTWGINIGGTASNVSGVVAAVNGGTGYASYTAGDLLYASGSSNLTKLPIAGSTGNVLIGGAAPSWGKVALTTHVSGTLPLSNGGTGQTTADAAIWGLTSGLTGRAASKVLAVNSSNTALEWIAASTYNPASVAITGGTINGTAIGGSTPAAGTFTALTATSNVNLWNFITVDSSAAYFINPRIWNPAQNYWYRITPSAITQNVYATLPLLTGNDTFVFAGHTQTLTNKTISGGSASNLATLSVTGNTYLCTSSGNVGIGTSSPLYKLDTNGQIRGYQDSSAGASVFIASNTSTANNTTKAAGIAYQGKDTVGTAKEVANIFALPLDQNWINSALSFWTRSSDVTAERMRIDSSGNVGIGTSSPSYKLHVAGDINLTGAVRVSGSAGTAGQVLTSSGGGAVTWSNGAAGSAGIINVKDFGAVGQGTLDYYGYLISPSTTADDSAAFNNAIKEAIKVRSAGAYGDVQPPGGIVHVPPGVYVLKNPVYLYGCELVGEGNGTIIVGYGSAFNASFTGGSVTGNQPLIMVGMGGGLRDMTIQYDRSMVEGSTSYSALYPFPSNALNVGTQYVIVIPGSGSWAAAGASANTAGTVFTATATSTGYSDGVAIASNPASGSYTATTTAPLTYSALQRVLVYLENTTQYDLYTGTGALIPSDQTPRAAYKCAVFDKLNLQFCGTAIACGYTTVGANQSDYKQPFSNSFTNIKINRFTYRGIDLNRGWRTGNVFTNISINNIWTVPPYTSFPVPVWEPWYNFTSGFKRWRADCGFNLGNSEIETNINQLNVENMVLQNATSSAINVNNCNAFIASTIHIEDVSSLLSNQNLITINNCAGSIESLMVCNDPFSQSGLSVLQIDKTFSTFSADGGTPTNTQKTNDYMRIGMLGLVNLDFCTQQTGTWLIGKSFNVLNRKTTPYSSYPYIMQIDNYTYSVDPTISNYSTAIAVLSAFPTVASSSIQYVQKSLTSVFPG